MPKWTWKPPNSPSWPSVVKHVKGILVVFDADRHPDDVEALKIVLGSLEGVSAVRPVESLDVLAEEANRDRIIAEFRSKIVEMFWPNSNQS